MARHIQLIHRTGLKSIAGAIFTVRLREAGKLVHGERVTLETYVEKLKVQIYQNAPVVGNEKLMDEIRGVSQLVWDIILMDVVMSCTRLIAEIGGDCTSILELIDSPKNIFEIVCSQKQLEYFTTSLLTKVVEIRDKGHNLKYGSVISKACRFINESHYFNYLFKKHTGLTPREYRSGAKKS